MVSELLYGASHRADELPEVRRTGRERGIRRSLAGDAIGSRLALISHHFWGFFPVAEKSDLRIA